MAVNVIKLVIVALLGALTVFTGTLVITLQVILAQRQQHLIVLEKKDGKAKKPSTSSAVDELKQNDKIPFDQKISTTTSSQPTKDIFLWKKVTPRETSKQYAGIAYWNQVKNYLGALGDVTGIQGDVLTARSLPSSSHIHTSLLQASKHGHSDAQHYVASALASGIWLTGRQEANQTMPEDFMQMTPQTMLLWHMAALDGNIESAVALGHRISATETDCSASLPYFEAAAHAIVDQLEAEKQSRAKINPPMDKHSLPEVHLHGGTSSQLTWDNKPDESPEAIQYYHLLSTRQPDPDVHAAYTLAHLYHFGLRGVPHNLTKAMFYYDIAAEKNHWEAAGQAGKFHFWSLGMEPKERNLLAAHKLFQKGAPLGLEGCRERYRQAVKLKTKGQSIEDVAVTVCDHPSLNGLGLLYLYGLPMILAVDVEKARSYFQLSRDMGNMDAGYNLAMLRLGFKSGWKEVKDVSGTDQSVALTIPAFMEQAPSSPSREQWLLAIQDLQSSANKGHIQARHRLGMIYQDGVQISGQTYVPKDCKKAAQHYRWVIGNASPQLSKRTRMAYRQYMAGDYEGALINYLMAAETGHAMSQVNAAFLLERGVCLHLSEPQCRTASLRLWKAAALAGDAEAALRVGDFYYYGSKRKITWLDVVLFPELHLLPVLTKHSGIAKEYIMAQTGQSTHQQTTLEACKEGSEEVCQNPEEPEEEVESDADLEKAAHYYRLASQQHKSARANFNLGYMHEWGLGLKQDFPLAKRHYDLAKVTSKQASLAVQIALMTMNFHEQVMQLHSVWNEWNTQPAIDRVQAVDVEDEETTSVEGGQKTKLDVIIKHVISWESLLIILLTLVLSRILQHRRTGR